MKFPARTCCRLAGIGIGVAIGGPLVGYAGSLLGDMTYDLLGDTLGGEDQLGDSIGGLLGNIAADAFPRAFQAPADYPDFNHDFRRALLLALGQALRGPVPRRYAQSVGQSAAKHALITRCLNQAADHLRDQMQQAVKKGDSAAFEALFPAGQVDSAFLDLQDDSLSSTADTLLALWYDAVLAPVIESRCATDLPHLGGASEFRRQTLAALATEFPAAFGSVLKDKDHQRLRIATQRLMLNEVRRTVQRLPQQIAGLDTKLTTFITAHQTDSALLAAMDGKLDALQSSTDEVLTTSKATLTAVQDLSDAILRSDPIHRYKANLTARFAIHNAVGIPAVEDPKQKQGPDKIVDLFVQPSCTEQRVSPEEMQEAVKKGQTKAEALLPRLVKDRRVVLLADPGMGKSTLIQWLVTALAAPVPSKDIAPFSKAIPLPIILREVVRDMPRELEKWNWQTLLETFLRHRHDEHKPAMAAPLDADDTTWPALLDSPQAWFMLDGLDEIGDPAKRRALRDAIWEGFEAQSQARFLITSRVVGYEEAEVDLKPLGPPQYIRTVGPSDDPEEAKTHLIQQTLPNISGPGTDAKSSKMARGEVSGMILVELADRLYLAPWDDTQQRDFSQHWFRLRLGESEGPVRAREFVQAVHGHPSTGTIGRVPNLLLLMALLFRHRSHLPHGRAEVYHSISKAYLQSIAVDHRIEHRTVPYTLAEKERLLAIIAMHMQVRRVGRGKKAKGEVLASRSDLEAWLCPEFGHGDDARNQAEMERFINHVADSSGLLLPRGMQEGQEQYAFAHLSFQEYYTACWLEREFRRLLNRKAGAEDALDLLDTAPDPAPVAPLALEEPDFAAHAAHHLWREPLLFLAERLAESPADTQTLRRWLFPIKAKEKLAETAQHLLATLSIDPQVNFSLAHRQQLWTHLWGLHLGRGYEWREPGAAPALLEPSEFQASVFGSLRSVLEKTPEAKLSLDGCTGISDLAPLAGLGSLQWLYLQGCTGLSDLAPLAGLGSLQGLYLDGCTGLSDLAPLAGLGSLQGLSLQGCTGLSDLAPLAGLGSLQGLYLDGCTGLSDLAPLAGLGSLQGLSLQGCTRVTADQVKALRKALPKCSILR